MWAQECWLSRCGAWPKLLGGMCDLPRPRIKAVSPALAGGFFITEPLWKPHIYSTSVASSFGVIRKIIAKTSVREYFPYVFFLEVLQLQVFKLLIHFKLIFVRGVRYGSKSSFTFCMQLSSFPIVNLLKRLSFPY